MKKSTILVVLLVFTSALFSQQRINMQSFYEQEWNSLLDFVQEGNNRSVDTAYDVLFYHLDINIAIDSQYVSGNVLMKSRAMQDGLQEIKLDLNRSLNVDSIGLNVSGFVFADDRITVQLDRVYNEAEEFEIRVFYQGQPAMAGGYKGLVYSSHGDGEPVVATLSTPFVAHYWYPCKDGPLDKPDSVYVDITVPDREINGVPLMGVSNGILEEEVDLGDFKTFKWRHRYPIVTYYVMAAVSNYRSFSQEYVNDSISFPLDYYVFDENYSAAQNAVQDFPGVFDFFNDVFGLYPFWDEKYGMTELGFYGAIENQTNTIINQISDAWFGVFVHELGHQWFGDMITCQNWHHGWLNEGFATYSEALYEEHINGYDAYKSLMDSKRFYSGGSLYLQNLDTFQVFQPIIYNKGAWALHMLRGVLGDDVFFEAIKNYASAPELVFGTALTEDFQAVCESTSGMDLGFYFDQWIYDEYYPVYKFNFRQEGGQTAFAVFQAQHEMYGWREVFEMPLQLKLIFTDGSDTLLNVWNDQLLQTYYFDIGKEVSSAFVDPEQWVLRKTIFYPDFPVAIDEMAQKPAFEIYPNPSKGSFEIRFDGAKMENAKVQVFDLQGRILKSVSANTQSTPIQIDTKSLKAGLYFVRLINNGKASGTQKLILE
jgi:aminopeptidase N